MQPRDDQKGVVLAVVVFLFFLLNMFKVLLFVKDLSFLCYFGRSPVDPSDTNVGGMPGGATFSEVWEIQSSTFPASAHKCDGHRT
eukprot:6107805-Amphidinium_carterae.1